MAEENSGRPTLVLERTNQIYAAGPYLEYLEDPQARLGFEDILSKFRVSISL